VTTTVQSSQRKAEGLNAYLGARRKGTEWLLQQHNKDTSPPPEARPTVMSVRRTRRDSRRRDR
jgi:hypothetical protein